MINGKEDQPTPPTSVELLAEAQKRVGMAILARIKAAGGINPMEVMLKAEVSQIAVAALAELLVSKGLLQLEDVMQATTRQMNIFAESTPTLAVVGPSN